MKLLAVRVQIQSILNLGCETVFVNGNLKYWFEKRHLRLWWHTIEAFVSSRSTHLYTDFTTINVAVSSNILEEQQQKTRSVCYESLTGAPRGRKWKQTRARNRVCHSDVTASYKMTEHLYRYGTCRVHGQFKDERRNEWQENENNCATRTMLNLLQKV